MVSSPALVRFASTSSGFTTSMSWSVCMSPAVTGPGPFFDRRSSALSRVCILRATCFRLSRMSTTSSCTPSMEVYSCSTPSISTSVIAAPGMDDSSTRRSALPSVWPKPRSNGSMTTRAWRGAVGCTFTTRGFRNSLTEPCIRTTFPAVKRVENFRLLRVELDDQVLVDVRQDFVPSRHRLEHATEFRAVHIHPLGQTHLRRDLHRALDAQLLLGLLAHRDHVAGLALVRRDGHDAVVHGDRLVRHQLARFRARRGESHAIHNVVETALEQLQQVLTRGAGAARRFDVVVRELALEHAVHAAQLLLLAQLQAVVRQALLALALDAARRHLELALALERLHATLQEKISAFATRELALGTGVLCHLYLSCLNAALLGRAAAVVRNRRDVGNAGDLETAGVQRAHRGFATGARSTDAHFDVLHTVFLRRIAGLFGGDLRRERRGLARTAETATTRGRPGKRVPLAIGDRDDGVVERRVHVRDAVEHVLACLLRLLRGSGGGAGSTRGGSRGFGFLFVSHIRRCPFRPCPEERSTSRPACADPCACARWCACAGHEPADPCDDGRRDKRRGP